MCRFLLARLKLVLIPLALFAVLLVLPPSAEAQRSETAQWAAQLTRTYDVQADILYHRGDGHEARLDLYRPANPDGPVPVLLYIHGGGWVGGSKEGTPMQLMPYLEKGWAAVTISYRLARDARAPAAVEDARCALRWIVEEADERRFDTDRIVVTGHSAGGHLSLTTGLLSSEAGLDRACPGDEPLEVAAIVNWFGITDVGDLLEGENRKNYAVTWMGSQTDRFEIAERVSPLNHVDGGDPPTLTVHGDADSVVPYSHATRLHEELDGAGVPNELVTIDGGGHGGFSRAQVERAYSAIDAFLDTHVGSE